MKRILIIIASLLCLYSISGQTIESTFQHTKFIKASGKNITSNGHLKFVYPAYLEMKYSVPQGDYFIIDGKNVKINMNGKKATVDTDNLLTSCFFVIVKEENNFLPPDNYQESRINKVVDRTSSTNIGLGLISVISAYDLKFIELDKALFLIQKMLETICKLPKWNGHLYNWYNIKTLEPLRPEYISTVDSGNFIGYIITLKTFK